MTLFKELKLRNTLKTGIAYLAIAGIIYPLNIQTLRRNIQTLPTSLVS